MSLRWTASGLAAVVLLCAAVPGQEKGQEKEKPATPEAKPDPRLALKERMKQRLASLDRLRASGKVGETFTGFVDVVKAASAQEKVDPSDAKSPTIGSLVEAENQDRKALYGLFAKDLELTPEEIGKQNGIRNFDKATPEQWLRLEDGRWVQKKLVRAEKK